VFIAAEFGSGQVLWSILWLFLFIVWIYLLIMIFSDIFRSDDLSGWGKALWTIAIILFSFVGILIYLIVRGGSMQQRQLAAAKQQNEAMQTYIRDAASGTSDADQLAKLADLHSSGKLDDAEYAAAKARDIG
jgi:hypothetical protein